MSGRNNNKVDIIIIVLKDTITYHQSQETQYKARLEQKKSKYQLKNTKMKHYQSLISKQNKFQSLQVNKGLQPIMEYDYYFQSNKNQSKTKSNRIITIPKNEQKSNNTKNFSKQNYLTQNNGKEPKITNINQQTNNKLNHAQKLENHQNRRQKQTSPFNKKITQHPNISTKKVRQQVQRPQKQTKVLSQHNPTEYSSNLFPQPQSIKQKLKQNLQQEMLNNYYINKYSTIMSKMTNENIKIQLPSDLTQRSSFSNTKDNESLMGNKKRKNFKQIMKQKTNTSQKILNIPQHNQSLSKRNPPYNLEFRTQNFKNNFDNRKIDDQLLVTISPIKAQKIQNRNQRNISKENIAVKSVNRHHQTHPQNKNFDSKLSSSRHSHYSRGSSKSPQHKSVNNFSSQSHKQNHDSIRESQKIRESQYSFKTNEYQSRQNSPQKRLNFKQSLKLKKSLYLEYEQNYDLYKKLQSSIIDELYSPSPRKIQKDKFKEIAFVNREMTKQEKKLIKLHERQGIKEFYEEGFQNIQVNQGEFDYETHEDHMRIQSFGSNNQDKRTRQIDLLRQSIRKSIQQSRNRSEMSSPRIGYEQKFEQKKTPSKKTPSKKTPSKKTPSKKTPNDSPQRSFISNKYKNGQSQGSIEKQQKWNPHFNSVNSHNKKYLNLESISRNKSRSSSQSPNRQERKYHSLEKTYSPKSHNVQPLKRLSSKLKNLEISQQKLPINEQENQFESDTQNNLQTTEHNESYNEVAKKLGNSIDMTEDPHKHISFKPHQRKGSFHSVRSDRINRKSQAVESRFIIENIHNSRNSNETVNEPSQQEDDVEFVPAANENLFSEKGSQKSKSKKSSPTRKNLIQTVGYTRSRKPSEQFSFISDSNSHHDFSMISRFSMTSEQGSLIIHKLENQITQNQFGPYQHALQSLRELLYEHKTAWPIYVVGQKILDDRTQYQKKIQLQGKIIQDYKQKILQMKRKQEKSQNQTDQFKSNQIKILRLIRQLCSQD